MSASGTIVIVGAGLAGSLLACDLARLGYRVEVLERRPDPRRQGFIGGRSINLALSVRGLTALERVGLHERVLEDAIRMPGRIMHAPTPDTPTVFQPYSADPNEAIRSVSRSGLNMTLLSAAEAMDGVGIRFGQSCEEVDLDGGAVTVRDGETGETAVVRGDLVIGADGAFSAVRAAMQRSGRFDYSQSYLEHGYKELVIPPGDASSPFTLEKGDETVRFRADPLGLHIWPRGGAMMIALPNRDGSFTCTLFWPFKGDHSFEAVDAMDDAGIRTFFDRWYPDAVPLMPTLLEDYRSNPTSSLVTVRCAPWHVGRAVLVGDAAHAIVPFFGQGMNAAFEDCRILAEQIERSGGDLGSVLPVYSAARKPNADAIADMALDNFTEMRDKVGSKAFLVRKRAEKLLHRAMPGRFMPLYNLVSFSNVPYAEARARARRDERRVVRAVALLAGFVLPAIVLLLAGVAWWTALLASMLLAVAASRALGAWLLDHGASGEVAETL